MNNQSIRCKTFYKIFIARFDCKHFSLSTIRSSKNKAKSVGEKVSSYFFHEFYLVILCDFIEDEKEMLKEVIVGWRKSLDMTEMEKDMFSFTMYGFTYIRMFIHSFLERLKVTGQGGVLVYKTDSDCKCLSVCHIKVKSVTTQCQSSNGQQMGLRIERFQYLYCLFNSKFQLKIFQVFGVRDTGLALGRRLKN